MFTTAAQLLDLTDSTEDRSIWKQSKRLTALTDREAHVGSSRWTEDYWSASKLGSIWFVSVRPIGRIESQEVGERSESRPYRVD